MCFQVDKLVFVAAVMACACVRIIVVAAAYPLSCDKNIYYLLEYV